MVTELSLIPTLFSKHRVAKNILDKISIWNGDITKLEVDVIVNAANRGLRGGGGVDGAIHRAAGTAALQAECRRIGKCEEGEAVITSACKMEHVEAIIHTVGPQLGRSRAPTEEEEEALISCYENSINLAVENELESISFPCISTGVYCYPHDEAANSVVNFLVNWLQNSPSKDKISRIVLCVFLDVDQKCYEQAFEKFAASVKE